jgi:phage anti-repressor protein
MKTQNIDWIQISYFETNNSSNQENNYLININGSVEFKHDYFYIGITK